jgi:hypothetical protein
VIHRTKFIRNNKSTDEVLKDAVRKRRQTRPEIVLPVTGSATTIFITATLYYMENQVFPLLLTLYYMENQVFPLLLSDRMSDRLAVNANRCPLKTGTL